MHKLALKSPELELPEGEYFADLKGLTGCWGNVVEVTDPDGITGLLVYVPGFSLSDLDDQPDEEDED